MPKRLAVGNYLCFLKRRDGASCRASAVSQPQERTRASAIEALESRTLLSTTYFVSPLGADAGPGTLAQPFKTIQDAANVAGSGDAVAIEAGTYRETIRPAHAGVTFANYNGQAVIVSGANLLTGWSAAGGSVYKASMPVDLGEGSNQVFVDGQMIGEARWPNSGPDLSRPDKATVGGYSNGVLYDQSITQGNGYWKGATITITPGQGWVAYTGVVNNSGPGWLQVWLPALGQYEQPVAGNNYFLSGTYQALGAPGQWYRDPSGNLYLWDPNGDNPAAHRVEVKARQDAFDLSGISGTTIEGINLFASTIHTDGGSFNTVINGISAEYLTQGNNLWGNGWWPTGMDGIELNGNGSILENSTFAFSAGDGVYVGGAYVRVTNNLIHDVDYSGVDAAGIRVYGAGAELDHNTIYNAGRDGINLQASPVQVLSNVIHDFVLQTYDGGGIYVNHSNGQGSPIAYNTVYNAQKNLALGYGATGIMLDTDSSNFVVHDNVTANVDAGFKANNTSYNEKIYNNQFGGTQEAMQTNGWTGFAYDWGGSQVYNNVFYNPVVMTGYNVAAWGNSFAAGSPTLNVAVTFPSAVPSAPPTPPASGGSVSSTPGTSTSPSQAAGSAGSASGVGSAGLSGTIQGKYRQTPKRARTAATYALTATQAIAAMGTFHVTGFAIGVIRKGAAIGTIRLANAKGVLTLSLSAPNATIADPTPTNFAYVVARATGAYKRFAASKGTINLAFTPATKPSARTFKLIFG